jgi:hypothetical protein
LRRKLGLERIGLPGDLSLSATIVSLLIPGMALYCRGRQFWGKLIMFALAVLLLIFLAGLGYPAGNLAFGCMLSLHVTSVNFLFESWLRTAGFRYRILLSVACLLIFGGSLYMPARDFVQNHWFAPLRINERVVVVHPCSAGSVRHGDSVAYRMMGTGNTEQVISEAGLGFGPVLAGSGDQIQFEPGQFTVNRQAFPSLPGMPRSGDMIVPQKHWFIWPNVSMSGHGNVSSSAVSSTMLRLSLVPEDQLVGKPHKRWFGRRQIIP